MAIRLIPARAGNTRRRACRNFLTPAHPRSRGEHSTSVAIGAQFLGSSPLARGTLSINKAGGAVLRLIPARAGNTKRRPLAGNRKPAHPRSRGEHLPPSSSTTESSGSSPLARGTQAFSTFTNTRTLAHPRSRGEHSHAIIRGNLQFGSSPLARGTLLVRGQWLVPPRLIPARAGNTPARSP